MIPVNHSRCSWFSRNIDQRGLLCWPHSSTGWKWSPGNHSLCFLLFNYGVIHLLLKVSGLCYRALISAVVAGGCDSWHTEISGPGWGSSSIKRLLDNLEAHGTKTDSVSLTFDLQRFMWKIPYWSSWDVTCAETLKWHALNFGRVVCWTLCSLESVARQLVESPGSNLPYRQQK